MKILLITPRLPYPPDTGAKSAMFNLIRGLSELGHKVCLLSLVQEKNEVERADGLMEHCRVVPVVKDTRSSIKGLFANLFNPLPYTISKYYSSRLGNRLRELVKHDVFDVIQTECLFMAYCVNFLTADIPTILREHNVESTIWERLWQNRSGIMKQFVRLQWQKVLRYESNVARSFGLCLTFTEQDEKRLRTLCPGVKTRVIPAAVDVSHFQPTTGLEEPCSLVFTGDLSWLPNLDGMIWFLRWVWPLIKRDLPEAKLYVVGRGGERLPRTDDNSTVITGYVRDVRPFVEKATACIVPLRIGGGIRIKILEAMSMQKPIVSTRVGCEGILVEHEKNILIADAPDDFAASTKRLLSDAEFRYELGKNGRKLAEDRYSVEVVTRALEETYCHRPWQAAERDRVSL